MLNFAYQKIFGPKNALIYLETIAANWQTRPQTIPLLHTFQKSEKPPNYNPTKRSLMWCGSVPP